MLTTALSSYNEYATFTDSTGAGIGNGTDGTSSSSAGRHLLLSSIQTDE